MGTSAKAVSSVCSYFKSSVLNNNKHSPCLILHNFLVSVWFILIYWCFSQIFELFQVSEGLLDVCRDSSRRFALWKLQNTCKCAKVVWNSGIVLICYGVYWIVFCSETSGVWMDLAANHTSLCAVSPLCARPFSPCHEKFSPNDSRTSAWKSERKTNNSFIFVSSCRQSMLICARCSLWNGTYRDVLSETII